MTLLRKTNQLKHLELCEKRKYTTTYSIVSLCLFGIKLLAVIGYLSPEYLCPWYNWVSQ